MVNRTSGSLDELVAYVASLFTGPPTKADFALVPPGPTDEPSPSPDPHDAPSRTDEVLKNTRHAGSGEWCLLDGLTWGPKILDHTRGSWPDRICNKRGKFWIELINPQGPLPQQHTFTSRTVTCTRLDDHTGRHAAASGGRIVAVWGERS